MTLLCRENNVFFLISVYFIGIFIKFVRFLLKNMKWSSEIRGFIAQHREDDVDRLLLSAKRYDNIDVTFCVDQILARRQLRTKLPEWYANDNLIMGGRTPAEQCSSEQTARYKRELVVGETLCDMTGGMGVDTYYMSRGLRLAIYTERQPQLCFCARHNFAALSATNIEVRENDARELPVPDVDTIYIDPARRAGDGSRVYDLEDCEPNVIVWQEELLKHCRRLIIKMSPMADVSRILKLLPSTKELHVVAIKGECKEVIAICEKAETPTDGINVFCIDFRTKDTLKYCFAMQEEVKATSVFADMIGKYLYEPDVTLLKSGVFKSLCNAFDVKKLDVNSHLYTSEELRSDFPGRIFEIDEAMEFSSKTLKTMKKTMPQANISARNFILTADQLRSRSGIKDGGEVYLFATAMKDKGNILLKCRKLATLLLIVLISATNVFAQKQKEESIETILSDIHLKSPLQWSHGMEFYFLNEHVNMILTPEEHTTYADTTCYRGTVWTFDAIVSEEDWMGQQTMALRFLSPEGKAYRFSTERLITQVADSTYQPRISGLFPKYVIEETNKKLSQRQLYILLNDDRISDGDIVRFEKFVPITVDSVSYGTELAPIKVYYTYTDGSQAFLLTSLPDTRENLTSTVITRFFSTTDPRCDHPEITEENWRRIQRSEVVLDMTREECRLSLGKYLRYETFVAKAGAIERWHYSGGRVLEFVDGRLNRIGREK